jgi:DNA-binding transcriptional ArsR family regulator
MVEYTKSLDNIFGSLSDPTRRDILKRLTKKQLSVGQIAKPYKISFAAVAKHLEVLEKAELIVKNRKGKEQIVSITPKALDGANQYLDHFERLWKGRLESLDKYLNLIKSPHRRPADEAGKEHYER